jgi:predicted DNA-binding transcriptional regulator YafY
MARYDQATRQFLLLAKLEAARRGLSLQELVSSLPEDYARHHRTVRRDLEALELQFPLIVEARHGRSHWRLPEGYRGVPQLAFSPTELMALVFSRDLMKPLDGTPVKTSLDSAVAKAEAALPAAAADHVRRLRDCLSVGLGPHKRYRQHRETIAKLAQAVEQRRSVQMRYYSASRNVTTRRTTDPYRLWYAAGALYLIAYCHTRRDVRMFAVDRIRSLVITDQPCQMPLGFDVESYVEDALVVMRGRQIEVELLFDQKTAGWVKDRQWHASQRLVQVKGGGVRLILRVADTRELLGWVLSFGAAVKVVRPPELRERVQEEAKKITGA